MKRITALVISCLFALAGCMSEPNSELYSYVIEFGDGVVPDMRECKLIIWEKTSPEDSWFSTYSRWRGVEVARKAVSIALGMLQKGIRCNRKGELEWRRGPEGRFTVLENTELNQLFPRSV